MSGRTILIVEDNELLRLELATYFKRHGFFVMQAGDGEQGMKMARTRTPDLLLTDIVMPEMDGIEQIKRLRTEFPNLKIIAMSGGGRTGNLDPLKLTLQIGADAVFSKPLNMADVGKAIANCLGPQPGRAV